MQALRLLREANETLHITQQNLVEFWAVATRPIKAHGLGYTTEQAAEIRVLRRLFAFLPELPLQDEWERIVTQYFVSGKSVHDERLVAAMTVQSSFTYRGESEVHRKTTAGSSTPFGAKARQTLLRMTG